jgi:transposase-like protein
MSATNTRKQAMLAALEKSLGVVTTAARQVGIERTTHYVWMKEDEDYKRAVESLEDVALDFAESKLHSLIQNEDTAATIFYLKTKGKKRGYIERQEITGNEGAPVIHIAGNI